jgi:hypothetical protein
MDGALARSRVTLVHLDTHADIFLPDHNDEVSDEDAARWVQIHGEDWLTWPGHADAVQVQTDALATRLLAAQRHGSHRSYHVIRYRGVCVGRASAARGPDQFLRLRPRAQRFIPLTWLHGFFDKWLWIRSDFKPPHPVKVEQEQMYNSPPLGSYNVSDSAARKGRHPADLSVRARARVRARVPVLRWASR